MSLHQIIFACILLGLNTYTWAVPAVTSHTAPLQQSATPSQANVATIPMSTAASITALQQKHKQELEKQQQRLTQLEQANQIALTQNQELQLKNDNLVVQAQVLQSERSAQMFLYGAVTFASGVFIGLLIYQVLYTRRRRPY